MYNADNELTIMVLNLSQRQMNNYFINLVLLSIVILSWVYAIIAGKFISERHLKSLDLLTEKEIQEEVQEALEKTLKMDRDSSKFN